MRPALALLLVPLTSGCIARAAMDVVAAPVKIVSSAADVLTTSQSEADEKRGRALRERDERIGKLSRKRDRLEEDCRTDYAACEERDRVSAEIDAEMRRPM